MIRAFTLFVLVMGSMFLFSGCGTCPCANVVATEVNDSVADEVIPSFTMTTCVAFVPSATDVENTCEVLTVEYAPFASE